MSEAGHLRKIFSLPVIVAALGYFVDIYDLVLFSIVRVPSLKALGLEGQALIDQGVFLLNMQMAGMLVGGILWGILGDRKGRLKIMFASIFLYSLANLANACRRLRSPPTQPCASSPASAWPENWAPASPWWPRSCTRACAATAP